MDNIYTGWTKIYASGLDNPKSQPKLHETRQRSNSKRFLFSYTWSEFLLDTVAWGMRGWLLVQGSLILSLLRQSFYVEYPNMCEASSRLGRDWQ
mmetsp:Transcript_18947/g.27868  ORF Transcript_18947/g.27868 Transcript_18947/m.27868 type:complete len:94 (+) Transcript_18947:228-509(+)